MKPGHKAALTLAVIFLFVFLCVIIYGKNGLLDLKRYRAENKRLVLENRKIQAENERLMRVINRLKNDPDYIEHIARKELGMVRPDETIIKFDSMKAD